jgi:hypothetical protein
MGLMQLLTVGKTIKGTRESPNRFKMSEQTLLPKFSSPARPAAAESPQAPRASVVLATGSLFEARPPRPVAPASSTTASSAPAPSILPGSQAPVKASGQKPRWSFFGRLFRRKPPRNTFGVPVQTEWKLEQVTVIRNDLSDSDLELIPAGRRPAPLPEPPASTREPAPQPAAHPQGAKGRARLSFRFFKSKSTQ